MRTKRLRASGSRKTNGATNGSSTEVVAEQGADPEPRRWADVLGHSRKLTGQVARLESEVKRLKGCMVVEHEVAATRPARTGSPRFEDLTLPIPSSRRSRLDKDDVDESTLDADELTYRQDGFLIKPGLVPEQLTEQYLADRLAVDDDQFSVWGGSYMAMPSMRAVCLYPPLVALIEKLIGQPLALFLTLSGLKTSRREWHQDFYLKAGYENIDYLAVWIAVGDVDPASGPYEFVPGSHRLPSLRKELVDEWLTPEERSAIGAPRIAERFVTSACNDLIREREYEVRQFVPRRGDVLVWHHSLLHQGSRAQDATLVRPGLIAHYNAISTLEGNNKSVERLATGGAYVKRTDQEAVVSGRKAAQALIDASAAAR